MAVSHDTVRETTRLWVERVVIGLNLCPFAKSVQIKGQVHYKVSDARNADQLQLDLEHELRDLMSIDADERDTALLIAPYCLNDFLDFNDFLDVADDVLVSLELDGVFQIASLHPAYQFAGTQADDVTNFTNRSPYPTLHLLREDSVERAVGAFPDPEAIFETNMATMRRLGADGWARVLQGEPVAPPAAPDAP